MENNNNIPPVIPQTPAFIPPVPPQAQLPEKKRSMKGLVIGLIVIVLIALGVYIYLTRMSESDVSDVATEPTGPVVADDVLARSFLERLKEQAGLKGDIASGVRGLNESFGLQINYATSGPEAINVYAYLSPIKSKSGLVTELSESYEDGSVFCMRGNPRRYEPDVVSDELSYVWCVDRKVSGKWEIPLVFKDIANIDAPNMTITAKVWGKLATIKVVGLADLDGNADGTFEDLVEWINKYPDASAMMMGVWNGDVLETKTIDWVNG